MRVQEAEGDGGGRFIYLRAEEEKPNAGGFGEGPPQTQSAVPTWGGQGHLHGLRVLPCALGQRMSGVDSWKKRGPTGHSGFCQFLSVCWSGWWEEAVSGYFLLWLFDLREGERRRGERWEQRRGERVKKGVSCGLRDGERGGGRERGGGAGGRVLFFARKQRGDILKEGVPESLCASVCPFLEAFGSWESVFLVTRGFEHGGLLSWQWGCGRGEAGGAGGSSQAAGGLLTTEGARALRMCASVQGQEARKAALNYEGQRL